LVVNDNTGQPLTPAPTAPGAVIERSPFTNSVIREGAQPPTRPNATPRPEGAAPSPPSPSIITNPTWEQTPNAGQISLVYPERAMRMEKTGNVRLRCGVSNSGAVSDCAVVAESPTGYGFGDAAVRLSPYFRMKPTTSEGQSVAGAKVDFPVR